MSQPPREFSDSDQLWLDRLIAPSAEPAANEAASEATSEATLLTAALVRDRQRVDRQAQNDALGDPALQERKLQELLFELRRQKLLPTNAAAPRAARRWLLPSLLAVAAAVALVVLTPSLAPGPSVLYNEPPVWRGELVVVNKAAAVPREAAQALVARLKLAGLDAGIYQQGERFVVDVDVSAAQLDAAAGALQAEGMPPRIGLTRVQFEPR